MHRHGDLRRAFRTARTVPAAGSTAPLSAPPLSRGRRNQRLRKLKIAKAAVRVYSILLSLATVFAADAAFNDLTVITSVGMAVFNLCSLFYNLFGSPRRYPRHPHCHDGRTGCAPSAPRQRKGCLRRDGRRRDKQHKRRDPPQTDKHARTDETNDTERL